VAKTIFACSVLAALVAVKMLKATNTITLPKAELFNIKSNTRKMNH
jgi:hypothetical protein